MFFCLDVLLFVADERELVYASKVPKILKYPLYQVALNNSE